MPRKGKAKDIDLEEEEMDDAPPSIEPYEVLGLERDVSADDIKKAYRKAALKHHPDKADEKSKDTAHQKFQEIAFAYAVLSDPIRKKRYDITGSTAESISIDDDFSWAEFYSEQFRDVITPDAINAFSKSYKGSEEEKDDVLAAYTNFKGKWNGIYQVVMLSDCLLDEGRFRGIIDEAIREGDVVGFPAYTQETEKQKERRMEQARRAGKEAEEHAKKIGVHDKLFGGGGESSEDALKALIQKRAAGRGSFLDRLEAKYTGIEREKKGKKKGKSVKKGSDEDEEMGEPSEEAFQAAAARLQKPKEADDGGERKAKKARR